MSNTTTNLITQIKKSGMSYGELSKATGIPKSALQRYATGQTSKIPVDRLMLISRALKVEPFSLLNFNTASEMMSELIYTHDMLRQHPPFGLDAEDIDIAYAYHGLSPEAKRIIKSVIESEKRAIENEARSLDIQ